MPFSVWRPLLASLPLWLAACATTPPPSTVPAQAAAQWTAPLPHQGQLGDLSTWWQRLDDPLLVALIDAAEDASPTVASAASRIAQARATMVAAGAALGPTLDASASASRGLSQPAVPITTTAQAGLQAAWEIDLFGTNRAAATPPRRASKGPRPSGMTRGCP